MDTYRHIVLDIDGTLFSGDVALDEKLPETLARLRRAGVGVSLLSGRMPQSMLAVVRALELPADGIHGGGDGAVIWTTAGKVTYDVISAPPLEAPRPYEFDVPGLALALDGIWIVGEVSQQMRHLAFITDPRTRQVDEWSEVDLGMGPVVGLRFLLDRPDAVHALSLLEKISDYGEIEIFDNGEFGEDVVGIAFRPRGRDKGVGLEDICSRVGVSPSQVVAFGDWVTDIPMFRKAGLSMVPRGVLPAVASAASCVSEWSLSQGWVRRELERLYSEILT